MQYFKLAIIFLVGICFSCNQSDRLNIEVKNETEQNIQRVEFSYEGNANILKFENIAPGEQREGYYEKVDPKNEKAFNFYVIKADGNELNLKGGHYRSGILFGTPTLTLKIGEDDIEIEQVE